MFDIKNLMGKVKEMQEKMQEAQNNLTHIKATGESGAGMVKATVNGKKQVISIEIDDSLVKIEEKQILQDLLAAAVNKANEAVTGLAQEEMKKATGGVMPNIPGLDLNNI